jgi:hypothetical protein
LKLLTAGLIVYYFFRKKVPNVGYFAAIAFLFTGGIFFNSNYFAASTLIMPLVLGGLLLFENKKYFWAGVVFGLAGLTKQYGLVPAFLLPIFLTREPKNLSQFLLGGFISFGLPNLFFWSIAGSEYLNLIVFNHFEKTAYMNAHYFHLVWKYNWFLLATLFLAFSRIRFREVSIFLLTGLVYYYFLLINKEVFVIYFEPLFAIAAILLGHLIYRSHSKIITFILVVLLIFSSADIVRRFSFHAKGSQVPQIAEITNLVEKVTKPNEKIFGSFSIAPLVALATDRDLLDYYFDTNYKWYQMGVISPEVIAQKILNEDGLVTLVTIAGKIEYLLPENFYQNNCRLIGNFDGTTKIDIYRCGRVELLPE